MTEDYKKYAAERKERLMPEGVPLRLEIKKTNKGVLVFFIQGVLRGDRFLESCKPAHKFIYLENGVVKERGHGSWGRDGFSCNSHSYVQCTYKKRRETRNIAYSDIIVDCTFNDLDTIEKSIIIDEYKIYWGIVE